MAASLSKPTADADIQSMGLEGSINVVCVNSPESLTISGDESEIEALLAELQSRSLFMLELNIEGPLGGVIRAATVPIVIISSTFYPLLNMRKLTANRKHSGQRCPTNPGTLESTPKKSDSGTSMMLSLPVPLP